MKLVILMCHKDSCSRSSSSSRGATDEARTQRTDEGLERIAGLDNDLAVGVLQALDQHRQHLLVVVDDIRDQMG